MERIQQIVLRQAEVALSELETKGFLEGGENGPYHDQETPYRVCSHWIIIFSYCNDISPSDKYISAVTKLANYIVEHQHPNGTFNCRNKKGKDHINGTIGVAWIIEGLIRAAKILNNRKYYLAARNAFFSQKFDKRNGLWKCIDIDDKELGFDMTYNHQLWLAAAGAIISGYRSDKEIDEIVNRFLEKNKDTFAVYDNGLIYHFVYKTVDPIQRLKAVKALLGEKRLHRKKLPSLQYKEEGYHYFGMYGFSIIHHYYPDNPFFEGVKFKKALNYTLSHDNAYKLSSNNPDMDITGLAKKIKSDCNVYGFAYNSPAFEIPFIFREFGVLGEREFMNSLMEQQLVLTYSQKEERFDNNTEDPRTLTARLYELIREL